MRISAAIGLSLALGVLAGPRLAAADSLVQKEAGQYKPGVAKSWQAQGTTVTFVLVDGADGAKAAQAIGEHVTGVQASFQAGVLKVVGLPLEALLNQLASLSVTGDDPLGELGALGGAVASAAGPEGGGSIRASRPADFAMAADSPRLDPREVFEAEVVAVKRGSFPQVVLRLRVRKAAESGPLAKPLHKGRVIEGSVIYVGNSAAVDLQIPDNQRNLAAFYLAAGDTVTLHARPGAPGQFDRVGLDWLERH